MEGVGAIKTLKFLKHLGLDEHGKPLVSPPSRPMTVPKPQAAITPQLRREKTDLDVPSKTVIIPQAKKEPGDDDAKSEDIEENTEETTEEETQKERMLRITNSLPSVFSSIPLVLVSMFKAAFAILVCGWSHDLYFLWN